MEGRSDGGVWDPASGEELRILKGHGSQIGSDSFSPDGQRIVTAGGAVRFPRMADPSIPITGDDQSAKVWDTADGKEVLTLKGHTMRFPLWPFPRDGHLLVSGSFDGTARCGTLALARLVFP